jgi:hypothetical protein
LQQTVDGVHAALEIGARSSYVPSAPLTVRSRLARRSAHLNMRDPRLEPPAWMK